MNRKRLGITLIEVLIVISILSFLISLILPAIFAARDLSLQLKSKNKLFALFLATEQLASIHNGQLPTSVELLSAKAPRVPSIGTSFRTSMGERLIWKALLTQITQVLLVNIIFPPL